MYRIMEMCRLGIYARTQMFRLSNPLTKQKGNEQSIDLFQSVQKVNSRKRFEFYLI